MESEMLSGIAQKAERTVQSGKNSLSLAQASQSHVRETPCYYSEGPRL